MARKQRKLYSLDEGLVQEFEKICKKRDMEFSAAVSQMMEDFVAKDGEMVMDELFAPRTNEMIRRTVIKEVDRIASMMYNLQVDVIANLYAVPSLYKKQLRSIETTFNEYMNEKILNENRVSHAEQFSFNEDGLKMVANLREYARKDMKAKKKVKEENQAVYTQ